MKKYIRSDDSAKIEFPILDIVIDIEYLIRSNIHASVDNLQNLLISDSSERHEVSDSFKTYMQSVVNVIESEVSVSAQDYKWLSDSSDPIDLVPVYITYEGDYIEKYNEILRDARRRLQRLKSDFPSET